MSLRNQSPERKCQVTPLGADCLGAPFPSFPLVGSAHQRTWGEGRRLKGKKKTLGSRVILKPQASLPLGPTSHSGRPLCSSAGGTSSLLPAFFPFFLFPIRCLLALYFVSSKATVQVTSALAPSHLMPYPGNLGPVEGLWPVWCACLLRSRPLRGGGG